MIDVRGREGFCEMVAGALGVVLFVSPWVLGYADEPPAVWNASIVGVLLAVTAALPFVTHEKWSSTFAGMLGVWSIASPWVLGFAGVAIATWTHAVIGVLVLGLAVAAEWFGIGAAENRHTV